MAEKMSLDELLSHQSLLTSVATVEAVEDEENLVKITPWVRGVGCLCNLALKLPKESIASVTPTGDMHFCCGKSLRVVEINFNEGSSISLRDLFAQLMQSAQGQQQQQQQAAGVHQHPFVPAGGAHR